MLRRLSSPHILDATDLGVYADRAFAAAKPIQNALHRAVAPESFVPMVQALLLRLLDVESPPSASISAGYKASPRSPATFTGGADTVLPELTHS